MSKVNVLIAILLVATLVFFVIVRPIYNRDHMGLAEEQNLNQRIIRLHDLNLKPYYSSGDHITRGELAAMIYSMTPSLMETSENNQFIDTKSHWAEKYINGVASKYLMLGYSNNTFKPNTLVTIGDVLWTLRGLMDYSGLKPLTLSIELIQYGPIIELYLQTTSLKQALPLLVTREAFVRAYADFRFVALILERIKLVEIPTP